MQNEIRPSRPTPEFSKRRKKEPFKKTRLLGLIPVALVFMVGLSACGTREGALPATETEVRPATTTSIETVVTDMNSARKFFYGNKIELKWNTAGRIESISAPSIISSPCQSTVNLDEIERPENNATLDERKLVCDELGRVADILHLPQEKKSGFVLYGASHLVELESVDQICEETDVEACAVTLDNINTMVIKYPHRSFIGHEYAGHYLPNFFGDQYENIDNIACVRHAGDGKFEFIMKSPDGYDVSFTTPTEYLATLIDSGANYITYGLSPAPSYIWNATEDIKRTFFDLGEKQRTNPDLSLLPVLVPDDIYTEEKSLSTTEFFKRIDALFGDIGGIMGFIDLSVKFAPYAKSSIPTPQYSDLTMDEACGIK